MLVAANGCSLPGDGLRRGLEALGFVRVAVAPEQKARVHVTPEGRAKARRDVSQIIRQNGTLTHPDGKMEPAIIETTLNFGTQW